MNHDRIDRQAAERLMKRCQIGVGGRHALDDAHSIMAECYGTIGALLAELAGVGTTTALQLTECLIEAQDKAEQLRAENERLRAECELFRRGHDAALRALRSLSPAAAKVGA